MSLARKLIASLSGSETGGGGGGAPTSSAGVFSVTVYEGTGAPRSLVTGVDLLNFGGLTHVKGRAADPVTGNPGEHLLNHSARGVGEFMSVNLINQELVDPTTFSGYNADGISFGNDGSYKSVNASAGHSFVAWTFRNADKFYNHSVVNKVSGSDAVVNFPNLVTIGMVRVKRVDFVSDWLVWHKSIGNGWLLYNNGPYAQKTDVRVQVTGTTVSLVNGLIDNGVYLVEAWADDMSSTGIVRCDTFSTNSSGQATVTLGWEPCYIKIKKTSSTGSWEVYDSTRGWDKVVAENTNGAESTSSGGLVVNSAGFVYSGNPSSTCIYMAVRKPSVTPTTGTQMFHPNVRNGTGVAFDITGVGFSPDLVISKKRTGSLTTGAVWTDKVRGATKWIGSNSPATETTTPDTITSLALADGFSLGADATTQAFNALDSTYVDWCFKRMSKVFDIVKDTGTGGVHTIPHNLEAIPELIIRKPLDASGNWIVYHNDVGSSSYLRLSATNAPTVDATVWVTTPTSASFTVGTSSLVNTTSVEHINYLFASYPGVTKVGMYTGNGTSTFVDCGFATGARFVLIKPLVSAGWVVFDTARGIVAADDPYLFMNTPAAEITGKDIIDPHVQGFIVNTDPTAFPANNAGVNYVFLAIA